MLFGAGKARICVSTSVFGVHRMLFSTRLRMNEQLAVKRFAQLLCKLTGYKFCVVIAFYPAFFVAHRHTGNKVCLHIELIIFQPLSKMLSTIGCKIEPTVIFEHSHRLACLSAVIKQHGYTIKHLQVMVFAWLFAAYLTNAYKLFFKLLFAFIAHRFVPAYHPCARAAAVWQQDINKHRLQP